MTMWSAATGSPASVVGVFAQETQGPEFGKSSPLGLLVVLLLLVGTAFLIWSMNKQLRKLPTTFDADRPEPDQAFDEGTDTVPDDDRGPAGRAGTDPVAGSAGAPGDTNRHREGGESRTTDESTTRGT